MSARVTDNFSQFSAGLKQGALDALAEVEDFKMALALNILARVVNLTPVDTGRLKGNWQVGINRPATGIRATDKTGDQTVLKGAEAIETSPMGSDIWITNNVNYATYIEFGTTHPDGTVKMEARAPLRRTLALVEQWAKQQRSGTVRRVGRSKAARKRRR